MKPAAPALQDIAVSLKAFSCMYAKSHPERSIFMGENTVSFSYSCLAKSNRLLVGHIILLTRIRVMNRHTHTHTHGTTAVTLAVHAYQGLIG